jgi:hypothetical protein
MRSSPWHAAVLATLIATSAHAGKGIGDYSNLPKDLADAATAYDVAQFKADRKELERVVADDYTLAGTSGKNLTKAEFIADQTAPGNKTISVDIHDQVSKVWSDGAVLAGLVDARGESHGKEFTFRGRFVDVWAKRNGRWQVVFTQIHAIP